MILHRCQLIVTLIWYNFIIGVIGNVEIPDEGNNEVAKEGTAVKLEETALAATYQAVKLVSGIPESNLFKYFYRGGQAIASCFADEEHVDHVLGLLKLDAHIYCNGTGRDIRRITCCTPQTTEEIDMKYFYYNPKTGENDVEIQFNDKKLRRKFSKSEKLVFIIHGWHEGVRTSPWLNGTRDAWLGRGHEVIVLDWSRGNQMYYAQSAANVRTIGLAVGYSIYHWKIWDRVLLVGFSLGAQVIGEAGKFIKSRGKMINECHALDPAGPYFDGGSNDVHLDRSDCEVVQVIHTSASYSPASSIKELIAVRLGTSHKVGNCDYWINCGHYQLGSCISVNYTELYEATKTSAVLADDSNLWTSLQSQIACSHNHGGLVYNSAVTKKCKFVTPVCADCGLNQRASQQRCQSDSRQGSNVLPPDSHCTSDMNVDYLLFTEEDGHETCKHYL